MAQAQRQFTNVRANREGARTANTNSQPQFGNVRVIRNGNVNNTLPASMNPTGRRSTPQPQYTDAPDTKNLYETADKRFREENYNRPNSTLVSANDNTTLEGGESTTNNSGSSSPRNIQNASATYKERQDSEEGSRPKRSPKTLPVENTGTGLGLSKASGKGGVSDVKAATAKAANLAIMSAFYVPIVICSTLWVVFLALYFFDWSPYMSYFQMTIDYFTSFVEKMKAMCFSLGVFFLVITAGLNFIKFSSMGTVYTSLGVKCLSGENGVNKHLSFLGSYLLCMLPIVNTFIPCEGLWFWVVTGSPD